MRPPVDPARLGFDATRLGRLDRHFARYVDDGRLAGWQLSVARHGETVHAATGGMRDAEAGLPVEPDTMWWLYSMTKPVTSVAAMSLWEEGAFELTDPVSARGSRRSPTCGSMRRGRRSGRSRSRRWNPCGCGTCSPTPPG